MIISLSYFNFTNCSQNLFWKAVSNPTEGSSKNTTDGFPIREQARHIFFKDPPERFLALYELKLSGISNISIIFWTSALDYYKVAVGFLKELNNSRFYLIVSSEKYMSLSKQ